MFTIFNSGPVIKSGRLLALITKTSTDYYDYLEYGGQLSVRLCSDTRCCAIDRLEDEDLNDDNDEFQLGNVKNGIQFVVVRYPKENISFMLLLFHTLTRRNVPKPISDIT